MFWCFSEATSDLLIVDYNTSHTGVQTFVRQLSQKASFTFRALLRTVVNHYELYTLYLDGFSFLYSEVNVGGGIPSFSIVCHEFSLIVSQF